MSTAEVDPKERLAYWSDIVCRSYVPLECSAINNRTIEGSVRASQLATLRVTEVKATAQKVCRTPTQISLSTEDFFLISVQTAGRGVVAQDGRSANLAPGDFALYDSTRPYTLTFIGNFQQYVLMLPGKLLRSDLPQIESLTARVVNGQHGAGHLLHALLRPLANEADSLMPGAAGSVADGVRQMLIAGLSTLPGPKTAGLSRLRAYQLERIRSCALARIREPTLTVAAIAAELKVSPSTIHRTWGAEGCSLMDWVWARRLDGTYRDLVAPGCAERSVSEVAFSWGFNDAAHFSRAFKARFGQPPSEIRYRKG
ncbi:MAG: helix-turn-helix domain-containing protein [Achromobacter sp.]|uniref:AraC-like ligand-binding domain-containing protein n=1 Tax=Achromobacter sp. TaxID=134375 RepID=UPI0029B623C1|nr:helix-turn-helix domain-containing protein [Achromobacter sp.]MDX3985757.1 helix-turn-helix domain-containing protein [Achromobacter sp.]